MGTQTVLIFDWDFPMEINHPASSPPRASRRHHGAVPRIQGPYLCTPRVVREHLRWKKHVETTQISHARCEMFTWVLHGFLDGGIPTPLKIWKSVGMMAFAIQAPYLSHIRREKSHHPHGTAAIQKVTSGSGKSHQGRRITMAQPVSSIFGDLVKSSRSITHSDAFEGHKLIQKLNFFHAHGPKTKKPFNYQKLWWCQT